ncbi:MAG: hypothetical protein ACD_3C00101G0002 [uncultured bacterium (gcode 4)]|uniref:Uncharacterized protein n=1 Tax=uncultured bacterium (gcode 4) TaxID=1234023 RepID=K2FAC6_9BACT|nr:MAG: hypothetical protein ACD_3C00101G0002 [uncultured bacterium (gcode 4)]
MPIDSTAEDVIKNKEVADIWVLSDICRNIEASVAKQLHDDGILDLWEFDKENQDKAEHLNLTRFVIKSEKIFGNAYWISTFNRWLISMILERCKSPWNILAWAENVPEEFYPKIILKIKDYSNLNLEKIFRSHAECMFIANELTHLSAYPKTVWLMTDIISVLPPKLAYQLISWINESYDMLTTQLLAQKAEPYFKEMSEKQKYRFSISVINNWLLNSIFPEYKEKLEIWNLLVKKLSNEWRNLWIQDKNMILTALMMLIWDNPEFKNILFKSWTKQLKIWKVFEGNWDNPVKSLLQETMQKEVDLRSSNNFINWKPFVIKMVFPEDDDWKKSYRNFLLRMKSRWWNPLYQEWEVWFFFKNVVIFTNDPNYLPWEIFLSQNSFTSEFEDVDIAVIRWHTQHICNFADEIIKLKAKLLIFWGCVWIKTFIKDIIHPKIYSLDQDISSVSDSVCIAPIWVGRSKINDEILMNIVNQLNNWSISLNLDDILKESNWEYQSFKVSVNQRLLDVLSKFNAK